MSCSDLVKRFTRLSLSIVEITRQVLINKKGIVFQWQNSIVYNDMASFKQEKHYTRSTLKYPAPLRLTQLRYVTSFPNKVLREKWS